MANVIEKLLKTIELKNHNSENRNRSKISFTQKSEIIPKYLKSMLKF